MKKLIVGLALAVISLTGYAQPLFDLNQNSPLLTASNYTVAPYVTYAHRGPTHVGGGVLVIYNVNGYFGTGLGIDYLGQLSLISGSVSLKYPIALGSNYVAAPFALAAVATPIGGAGPNNGGVATIEGAGISVHTPLKLFGGHVGFGAAYMNWNSVDAYSGGHEELFLTWRKSF